MDRALRGGDPKRAKRKVYIRLIGHQKHDSIFMLMFFQLELAISKEEADTQSGNYS